MHNDPTPELLRLSVPDLLRERAKLHPVNLALSARSEAGWRDRLTYGQLVERMDAVARGLAVLGIAADDRIAIFLSNDAGREAILTSLGALRLNAAVAPLNTRAADDELAHALALVEPAAIVVASADAQRLHRLWPRAKLVVVGQRRLPDGAFAWPEPTEVEARIELPGKVDPLRLGCLLFTSGTTARSKAVMHTHSTMIGAGLCCGLALGLRPGDLYQGGWPFFTSSGLNLGCMSSWVSGAGLVFEEVLTNAGRLRLIESERSTFYHGVPSVIHFMIDEFACGRYDASSLRRIGYGGSAMPMEVVDRLEAHWPHIEQVQIYGLTESGPTGTVLEPAQMRARAGSIGVAMPYCSLRIVDGEGRPLPAGETGEILLAGPGVAAGYFRNETATREAFVEGIRTGDVGHVDADGFLYFTDRRKDIINRGGLKISSVAVEEALYRHSGVREVAVVAVPHQALGEDVAACIVRAGDGPVDADELARFCESRLADYQRPRKWLFLDEIPKNPMGKVLKTELRKMFAAQQGG